MARPPTFGEPASEVIVVRVTPGQKRALTEVARDNITDVASVIRDAVDGYVADYRESGVFRIPKQTNQ